MKPSGSKPSITGAELYKKEQELVQENNSYQLVTLLLCDKLSNPGQRT